ncbi:MAG: hypothetical protein IKE14_11805 [Loktanella sp.]|nr:hypothetical protein [Loktanella sp.]
MWKSKSRQMLLGGSIVILGTGVAGSTISGTKELTREVHLAIPHSEAQPNIQMRQQFASAILAYWIDFDTRVPRLSPSEKEWIANEFSGSGDRLERVINSREYALDRLTSHTDQCIETAQMVLGTFEVELRRELEMYYWLQMVNCYDGSNDVQIYLRQAGIPFNDEAGEHVQVSAAISIIQDAIVNKAATMAMAEVMDWVVTPK